jgi:hypothetical protein
MGLWKKGGQLVFWRNPDPLSLPNALAGNSDCCRECQCYLLCFEKVSSAYTSTWNDEIVGDYCSTTLRQPVPPQPPGVLYVWAAGGKCGEGRLYCSNDLTAPFGWYGGQAWQWGGDPCPSPTDGEAAEEGWQDAPRLFYQYYYRARIVDECADCCTTLEDVPGEYYIPCQVGVEAQSCGGHEIYGDTGGAAAYNCSAQTQLDICLGTHNYVYNQPCPPCECCKWDYSWSRWDCMPVGGDTANTFMGRARQWMISAFQAAGWTVTTSNTPPPGSQPPNCGESGTPFWMSFTAQCDDICWMSSETWRNNAEYFRSAFPERFFQAEVTNDLFDADGFGPGQAWFLSLAAGGAPLLLNQSRCLPLPEGCPALPDAEAAFVGNTHIWIPICGDNPLP